MGPTLPTEWQKLLQPFFDSSTYRQLRQFLVTEYKEAIIHPVSEDVFKSLQLTPYSKVKVVILGQDPYHGEGQANGLAFSVQPQVPLPPSLRNIYKELESDLQQPAPPNGDLTFWAQQGVLLLNTVLTVRHKAAFSHRGHGWEELTNYIIQRLNERNEPIVFILWGNASIAKRKYIDESKHAVITSSHPSPLAAHRGFFGSKPFSQANNYLKQWHEQPIEWSYQEN